MPTKEFLNCVELSLWQEAMTLVAMYYSLGSEHSEMPYIALSNGMSIYHQKPVQAHAGGYLGVEVENYLKLREEISEADKLKYIDSMVESYAERRRTNLSATPEFYREKLAEFFGVPTIFEVNQLPKVEVEEPVAA